MIDWISLLKVAAVSLLFGVGIVTVFSLGLAALPESRTSGSPRAGGGAAVAGVCFLACAAAVLYGIYLIVPQFH